MKILIYRMFFHKPFTDALNSSGYDISFFSSERRMDETGVIDSYYCMPTEAKLSNDVIIDIIMRCRYLSGINLFEARLKVRKMWAAVESYFDRVPVDLVLSPAVDNYVTDIWFKVASKRQIPSFQPRRSPLPGLVRITNSIDNPVLRSPQDKDVQDALAHLGKNFKADYQNTSVRSTKQIAARAAREFAKKMLFEYWKVKYSDKDSFHYNAIFPNKNAITIKSPSQLWFHKRFISSAEDVERVRGGYEKVVFWPLAMAPESALCYLNADSSFSDYRDLIGKVVDALPDNMLLVIKEHPSAIGYRAVEQYSKLLSKKNIIMCNPGESTGRLISIVDAVLVNTSSTTGLEAVAVGKPVLALGSCHYNVTGVVDEINKLINVDSWPDVIRTQELSQLEKEQVIHKYLSNTIEDATWALAGIGKTTYHEQICRTLDKCIDMANSGYVSMYHGN
jgi:hypothetical protein